MAHISTLIFTIIRCNVYFVSLSRISSARLRVIWAVIDSIFEGCFDFAVRGFRCSVFF